MYQTTDGIVLAVRRQGERSMILTAYTEQNGRQDFALYGAGGKRAIQGIYRPLQVLELTADIQPNRPVHTLREARLKYVPTTLDRDFQRQTIALFIAEVIFRTIPLPLQDKELYDFLLQIAIDLDKGQHPENIHLEFLVGLIARLGFAIDEQQHPELIRIPTCREERQVQLIRLCDYMENHLENWVRPKSMDVLRSVFDA